MHHQWTDELSARMESPVCDDDIKQRLFFLAEAGQLLSSSLDFPVAMRSVLQVAMLDFADWAIVDLLAADGAVDRYWLIPSLAESCEPPSVRSIRLLRAPPGGWPLDVILETGDSQFVPRLSNGFLEFLNDDPPAAALAGSLDLRRAIGTALIAKGRTFGSLWFCFSGSTESGEADLIFAESLAARSAQAIDNAIAFRNAKQSERRHDHAMAMLAHEVRNALVPALNAVKLVRQSEDRSSVEWGYDVMERQLRRMARLVDDLLEASRLEHGKVKLRCCRLHLDEVIGDAIEDVRPLIDDRRIELTVRLPDEPLWIEADKERLEQILTNLLRNALLYTEPAGHIVLVARRDEQDIVVSITDDGIGMTPETIAGIFNLFAQSDQSQQRSAGGLGIGLALARALVELHGGSITAHSDGLGAGSEFEIRLPITPSDCDGPSFPLD